MARFFPEFSLRHILVAAAALAGMAAAACAADHTGSLQVGGTTRTFLLHVPTGAPPNGGFPLVLMFHGGGGQGSKMQTLTHLNSVADARNFIVAYPDGIDKHWNDGRSTIKNPQDDVGFVSALLDQLEKTYPIDAGRIYATGISNGALFTERLACDLSQRIAAIAPVAGTLPADLAPKCKPTRPVAVLQIDGTSDPIMPFEGGDVTTFGSVGEGGKVLSVASTLTFWARHDKCGVRGPATPLPPIAPLDPTRVISARFSGCSPAGPVDDLTIVGGGHTWPGGPQYARPIFVGLASRQIDATGAIADFFLSLPRR